LCVRTASGAQCEPSVLEKLAGQLRNNIAVYGRPEPCDTVLGLKRHLGVDLHKQFGILLPELF